MRLFWTTSLAAEMEYRTNFLISSFTSLGNLAGSIFLIHLVFQRVPTIEGWSFDQSLLVMGFFTILGGVANTVLRANLSRIVQHVREGTMDFILLKPIDSQFHLSVRRFISWGLPDIAYGILIVVYAGMRLDLGLMDYAAAVLPLAAGLVTLYSLWFMLGATSIWFVKVHNVTYVLSNLLAAGRFPIALYPVAMRVFFTFIVPVAFLTTVPAQAMLGRTNVLWLIGAAAFAAIMFLASRAFWHFALRHYTSASS